MKTRMNRLNRSLYSNFSRFTIDDIPGLESMQRFFRGVILVLTLFIIITGNAKAATFNAPASASIHNGINEANSREINVSEGNNVTNYQSTIQVFPVPVITWPTIGAVEYTTTPTLSWYLSGSISDTVTYSVMVRDSTNPIYSGLGYFFIQGTTADSVNIYSPLTPGTTYFFIVIASFSSGDSTE